jgi:hypothetical protein
MTEQLEKAQWSDVFTDLAKTYHGFEARLEIIGRAFGDQEAAAWMPFPGISYDPHHDQVFITLGGSSSSYPLHLTRTVEQPHAVSVHRTPDGTVSSILVVSGDKTEMESSGQHDLCSTTGEKGGNHPSNGWGSTLRDGARRRLLRPVMVEREEPDAPAAEPPTGHVAARPRAGGVRLGAPRGDASRAAKASGGRTAAIPMPPAPPPPH